MSAVRDRLDDWGRHHQPQLQMVSVAWVSLTGERSAPLSETAGALASNPTAAVVSARSEGRYGGVFECAVVDLPQGFEVLSDSDIGSVQPVGSTSTDIGLVFDRWLSDG